MADSCCSSYTRSRLLHAAAARAGDGLPAVERGMPVPAGTGLSRRSLLLRGGALTLSVYGASHMRLGALADGVAEAAALPGDGRVLVSIFAPGGWDSLTLLAPVGDPAYPALRPALGLPGDQGTPLAQDPRLHFHPAARGLAALHGEGKVSVLPAVGYDHPDQSHFTSRHYWEVGATDASLRAGWLGRYLDVAGAPANPLQGLSLNDSLAPALAPRRVPVATLESPAAYTFDTPGVEHPVAGPMLDAIGGLGGVATPVNEPHLGSARGVSAAAGRLRGQMRGLISKDGKPDYRSPVPYPKGDLAQRLAAVAAMIAAGLPLRVVAVEAHDGDFDTHADQAAHFAPRVQAVGDAVLAFQRDLEARGLADRVLTHMWSEFGRRPQENGSGTDHGAAGAGFVIGTRTTGGLVGEFPGLGVLDDRDNLRMTSDFRGVYCALLEQWLGQDAAPVIPGAGGFARPKLVR
jgi:uncharacterized protein (DUF1501 family)